MSLEQIQQHDVSAGPYTGSVCQSGETDALCDWAATLGDHVHAPESRVITAGRNRNVQIDVALGGQLRHFHVKSFGGSSRGRGRGSKARRTWDAALHLTRHGVPTPRPIAYFERVENGQLTESYFISEYEADTISFTDVLSELFDGDPQCHAFMEVMQFVADAIRGLHAAGFQHNDLGNQNILLQCDGDGDWRKAFFIDLNRGRICESLTPQQRARDLSRIALPSDLLRVFNEMYFRDVPPEAFLSWDTHYRRRFAFHTWSRPWRHPVRTLRQRRKGDASESPYPHPCDMWIFDNKSAQAIVTTQSKHRRRHYPLSKGLIPLMASLRYGAKIRRASRDIETTCFREDVTLKDRFGVGVDPRPDDIGRQDTLLEALGNPPVLVRLYHHQDDAAWTFRTDTIKRWAASGQSVAVAIVQDRKAFLDPESWQAFVARSLEACAECAAFVEVGHAINRVKWGLWDLNEWTQLMTPLVSLCQRYPNVRLTGPAVIDFEYPVAIGALSRLPEGIHYHALSHHLYVDRRGAPENRQGRFGTVDKLVVGRAIARVMPGCDERLIISEVNWPLAGTGEYSPVTSPYESPGPRMNDPNVSEDDYADYMLRYLCIAICSGMAEQVYWWRLVARGFGLVDDTTSATWRERPAFKMLKHFLQCLGDSRFVKRLLPDGEHGPCLYLFACPDGETIGLLSQAEGETKAPDVLTSLAVSADHAEDAFGERCELGSLRISGRPVYLRGVAAPSSV